MLLTAGRTTGTTRKKAFGKTRGEGEKARGSSVRREVNTLLTFCSCKICHPVVALPTSPQKKKKKNTNMSSRQLSESRAIPTRRVLINDTTQLPHDYCTTPGGTLFSTTPGGMWSPCQHGRLFGGRVDVMMRFLFFFFPFLSLKFPFPLCYSAAAVLATRVAVA